MADEYWIYLRKSRKDVDAEAQGAGETLARHEKELLSLAKRDNYNITRIFREVVSGESIEARPEVQKLLEGVSLGGCKGVLVMEVERLARGNTKDQGIVAEAFTDGHVKIITPMKVYDPDNEFDQEYFEFGLFMSRQEYKTIKRRLYRGRLASVKEGKWISSTAPYGYKKVKLPGKGYSLEIVPDEATVIKSIFGWYHKGKLMPDGTYRPLGMTLICNELDRMNIKPVVGAVWSKSSIKDILTNPAYMGMVRWGWKPEEKIIENGVTKKKRTKRTEYLLCKGLHEAIISEDIFNGVQEILAGKFKAPVVSSRSLKNPLSGLIYCQKCGKMMTRQAPTNKTPYPTILCPTRGCDNVSSPLELVESSLISMIQEWVQSYKLYWENNPQEDPQDDSLVMLEQSIRRTDGELEKLQGQLSKTFDLLEQGIYSVDVFSERNKTITNSIQLVTQKLDGLKELHHKETLQIRNKKEFIPKVEALIDTYYSVEDTSSRNQILKEILHRATYLKETANIKFQGSNVNFELHIFPNIPV